MKSVIVAARNGGLPERYASLWRTRTSKRIALNNQAKVMKILAVEKEAVGFRKNELDPKLLENEAMHAWELQQAGKIREMYFRSDKPAAILILECDSSDQAKAVLSTLPLVRDGLIEFEIIPLVAYPGFQRLFKK
jgi:muconolactone delta-isomerase